MTPPNYNTESSKYATMENTIEGAKIAVVLRAARAAIGWNQQQFADKMGVAKSTVARIETLDMAQGPTFL